MRYLTCFPISNLAYILFRTRAQYARAVQNIEWLAEINLRTKSQHLSPQDKACVIPAQNNNEVIYAYGCDSSGCFKS